MAEDWVNEAVSEQEEYLKRRGFCQGIRFREHSFDNFAAAPGVFYRACWVCRVTETRDDYAVWLAHRPTEG